MAIQCIFIGNTGVGKTSIIQQAISKKATRILPTVGVECQHYRFKETDLNIWDTSGLDNFHSLIRMFEKQCNSIVYVFDASSPTTLQSICDWHDELYDTRKKYFCICNKIDLSSSKEFETRITYLYPEIHFLESSIDITDNGKRLLQTIIEYSNQKDEDILTPSLPRSCCKIS